MPNDYKILGQGVLSTTTGVNGNPITLDLYTVPAGKSAIISTFSVKDTVGTGGKALNLAVRIGGATIGIEQYVLAYRGGVNDSGSIPLGLTLSAGDVLSAITISSAGTGFYNTFNMTVFGTEIS